MKMFLYPCLLINFMKQKSLVLIIDFYDSFTFNIASELYLKNIPCRVVPYDRSWEREASEKIIIWGPGPGHPRDYSSVFPQLKKLFADREIFHMGICLGHQLFFSSSNYKIEKCITPMHGQTIPLKIPRWKDMFSSEYFSKGLQVQRYNSLAVKDNCFNQEQKILNRKLYQKISYKKEVIMSYGENWISYQFHPESVATEGRKCFFEPLAKFLYNKECSN